MRVCRTIGTNTFGMSVTTCNEIWCKCFHRCVSCDYVIVNKPDTICNKCSDDVNCDSCNISKHYYSLIFYQFYSKPKAPITVVSYGKCRECGSTAKQLDKQGLCKKHETHPRMMNFCSTCYNQTQGYCSNCDNPSDVVTFQQRLCPECEYGRNWSMNPEQPNTHCKICKQYKLLDNDKVCQQCYTDLVLNQLSLTDKFSKCHVCTAYVPNGVEVCKTCQIQSTECKECKKHFTPNYTNELFCTECQRKCLGCEKPISTSSRFQVFCPSCNHKRRDGICVGCSKPTVPYALNVLGFCGRCTTTESLFGLKAVCPICNTTEVNHPEEPCEKCKSKDYHCLVCNEKIGYAFYACLKHR